MTCHDYKDLMMGYLDDELSDESRRRFEEHVAGCPECAGELKEFKRLKVITDEVTLAGLLERDLQSHRTWRRVDCIFRRGYSSGYLRGLQGDRGHYQRPAR